jgi:hypothetical protein
MTNLQLRLPNSDLASLQKLAARENVTMDQLAASALAENVAALMGTEYLEQRAKRGSREKFGSSGESSRCSARPSRHAVRAQAEGQSQERETKLTYANARYKKLRQLRRSILDSLQRVPADYDEVWAEASVALAREIMEPGGWGELPAAGEQGRQNCR